MKRALIINEWPSYLINESGCNVFSYKLINFLNEHKFCVDEIILKTPLNNINWKTIYPNNNYNPIFLNLNLKDKFINKINFIEDQIEKIINNNKYDIIISNFHLGFNRINKYKNFFFVPHNSYEIITKYGIGTKKRKLLIPFYWIIRKLINHKNPFLASNIIVFDPYTKNKIIKTKKYNNSKVFLVPIFHNFFNEEKEVIYENKRENVFYIGRLANKQKNLKLLNKVADYIDIHVYGGGGDEKILSSPNIKKFGIVKDNKKENIFKTKKVMIMTSRYEGSPIVLIEALSFGIPIVLLDTFPFAKYVTNETGSVLLNKKSGAKKFGSVIKQILELEEKEYRKLQIQCFDVYLKKFSNKVAEQEWKKIISSIN
ncbi:glycosyltransferase [Mesomycoplasma moatsii]|uniref:glycosyltransferase n=1 Tax=Mesomycoplasma moatsii TaxID=171287 RepID=UPI0003B47E81